MSTVVSKLGIHCIGPRRNGYGGFLQSIDATERRLAVVKVRDDLGAMDEPLALWPEVLCIGAFTDFDGLPFDFTGFSRRAALKPQIKYWEVLNEINGDWTAQADLYLQIAQLFDARGWRLCMFNCGSGTPRYDDALAYDEIARACRTLGPRGHILGVHGYSYDRANELLRYRDLHARLVQRGVEIPIAITEFGPDPGTFIGTNAFVAWCMDIDQELMRDDYVLGAALWTLGGGGWQGVNFEAALPMLGEYIATVEEVEPPPPPPPPPPPAPVLTEHFFTDIVTQNDEAATSLQFVIDQYGLPARHYTRPI